MDEKYSNKFPDGIVETREDLEEEKVRINNERQKMEEVETIYTAFDSIGGISVRRLNPAANDVRMLKIEAKCSSLDREPVESLLKMGGTAEWDGEEGYYKIKHEISLKVR